MLLSAKSAIAAAMAVTMAALLVGCATVSQAPRRTPFAEMRVIVGSTTFVFSKARATDDDPVLTAIMGRETKPGDRRYFLWMQQDWLTANVPQAYELVARERIVCNAPGRWDNNSCDRYSFRNPATGLQQDYYLFVGNWP